MQNERRANANSFLHGREIAAERTRNCFRTNADLFSHEHEIDPARSRNGARTPARNATRNAARNAARNCCTKFQCECFKRFLDFGNPRGRSQTSPGNQFWSLFVRPFWAATLAPFRAGNFVRAISCGQFRAGNFALPRRSSGRPCLSAAAGGADRLRMGRRLRRRRRSRRRRRPRRRLGRRLRRSSPPPSS